MEKNMEKIILSRKDKDEIIEKVCELKEVLKSVEKEVLLVNDNVDTEFKKEVLEKEKKLEEVLDDLEKVLKK